MATPRRIILFTGEGKGKTTAALGMVLRAAGHGRTALVVQFLKRGPRARDPRTGEVAALALLPGVEIVQTGRGFVPRRDDPRWAEHRQAAQEGLSLAQEAVGSGRYDLVVLDEICGAVTAGLLEEEQVIALVEQGDPRVILVLTGRGAGERLIALADTVTEMRCLKHGYQAGIPAQPGVEF
jgi:cob(I)alamin adenosyltransferase